MRKLTIDFNDYIKFNVALTDLHEVRKVILDDETNIYWLRLWLQSAVRQWHKLPVRQFTYTSDELFEMHTYILRICALLVNEDCDAAQNIRLFEEYLSNLINNLV